MNIRETFGMSPKALVCALWKAARPLSLSLAFYSTSLGAALAVREGALFGREPGARPFALDLLLLVLVTATGLAAQTATNFINDYFECGQKNVEPTGRSVRFLGRERPAFDILVFACGIACFAFMCAVGLWFVVFRDWRLVAVGVIGLIGGYCYTGEPVVYKRFGLGAILSFALLGPLMTFGSHLALAGYAEWESIWLPLPVSLLIPLLMLSNELRDFDRDRAMGIRTLAVRIGFARGKALYASLIALAYVLPALFAALGHIHPAAFLVVATLPLAWKSWRTVSDPRANGVPPTNLLHLAFGAVYGMCLLLA